jgi:hypothetical protein
MEDGTPYLRGLGHGVNTEQGVKYKKRNLVLAVGKHLQIVGGGK